MSPISNARRLKQTIARPLLLLSLLSGPSGCGYMISSATEDFSERLKQTVLAQNDPQTVTEALPAYLLMLEASAAGNRDDEGLMFANAKLYTAFLSLLPDDTPRKPRLSRKALDFALRGLCLRKQDWCDLQQRPITDMPALLAQAEQCDTDSLYSAAAAWSTWIQANKSDWNAIAQLAQVKQIMQKVIELDETHQQGSAHVYLAVLESLIPETLGGRPELAKQHFQRALQLAPDNLMINVLYAKHYARMIFDRELHDTLLKTTLSSQVTAPGLTLINTLAQQQAQQLLDSANDYF
ncbi:TRAP transporter TatT component family protein [Methylomonas sp. SURF-2]|uniref:TRAP transporter TatT component family protein n=1 Tax=Methylomonas subterranea TaxID=2952225 RepID=A0ABT1TEV7_9GAMM|nr:TRAP transporter TatT component family protein [Methylomonas sp. SURF-2]MCQ8103824.1 TRAP transporter TatT component family protein [Methylomonas sp. SURF-2]